MNEEDKWEHSKFSEKIRISREDKEYVILTKGKKSQAGRLKEIIEESKNNYYKQNT
jgi:hypothetical protein